MKFVDPDGRDVNPSNMGLKPERRQKMNSLQNLAAIAKHIKQSGKSNGIDLKLSFHTDGCWARATVIREELEKSGFEVEGYTIVISPLKYEAKQKVKRGQLNPSDIPMNDEKNRFSYHVGITVKIDDELYVIDPFYDEYSPGLSKQNDWIKSQYGAYSDFQKKDTKYAHLESFERFRNKKTGVLADTKATFNLSVQWLNEQ